MIGIIYEGGPVASITQMEYALAVLQHRHFGKAADAVHVSQPTLSMQLQKLEEELGAVLFDRSKKPIIATERGAELLQQMQVIVEEQKRLLEMTNIKKGQVSGEFRLGVIPTLSPYLVPRFIQKFSAKYPRVNLTIEELKTSDIMEAIDQDRIDAGLLVTPLKEGRFEERVLFYEPFYLYVSQEHAFFKRTRIKESELDESDIWLLGEGHCLRNQIVRLCSVRKKRNVVNNVIFESGSLETLKSLVDHSQGYTLLPHLAVMNLKDADSKKKIKPFVRPIPTREVSLVYRRKQLKQNILDGLSECILQSVPKALLELDRAEVEVVDI